MRSFEGVVSAMDDASMHPAALLYNVKVWPESVDTAVGSPR